MHFSSRSIMSPGRTIEVSVAIGGREQELHRHLGEIWVAGEPGQAFTLRVRNLTAGRVEIVNTVDGRNTLRDEPGSLATSRGMAFGPYESGEFRGWRHNLDDVRDFVFANPQDTIATQATGSVANLGVIGFAVFQEEGTVLEHAHHPHAGHGCRHDTYAPRGVDIEEATRNTTQYGSAKGGSAPSSIGTGMGDLPQHPDRVRLGLPHRSGQPALTVQTGHPVTRASREGESDSMSTVVVHPHTLSTTFILLSWQLPYIRIFVFLSLILYGCLTRLCYIC